jgi:hypothetical protein
MGVYIKNWQMADWKELLKWAKIGANNAMIGEFTEVEEVPAHGRLIDADELFKEMERKGWFDNADRDNAEDLVLAAPTIMEAEEASECLNASTV